MINSDDQDHSAETFPAPSVRFLLFVQFNLGFKLLNVSNLNTVFSEREKKRRVWKRIRVLKKENEKRRSEKKVGVNQITHSRDRRDQKADEHTHKLALLDNFIDKKKGR